MNRPRIDFSRLKSLASFELILARYGLAQNTVGTRFHIVCPFHAESIPSCHIDLQRKRFRCFGCGARGSILDFVAKFDRCGIAEAATIVASCCRIPERDLESNSPPPADTIGKAPNGVVRQEQPDGPTNPQINFDLRLDPAHPYFAERGLTPELVARFGLGYCSQGYLRGRIAVPIHDERGTLVGYAGRWAARRAPPGRPRYLLPRGFHKQTVLYNFHRVRGERHLVIVESYWSVFRLSSLGVPTIGLMGRELSLAHVELLRQEPLEQLSLMLDGDEPGRQSVEKMLPRLARQFFVKNVQLPDGQKPHSAPLDVLRSCLGLR